jgi:hypothetical protein
MRDRTRDRRKRRVDWDEELRKTERIRRKGLFTSALSFGVALIFDVSVGRMSEKIDAEAIRKVIFAFCFVVAIFLFRAVLVRRARLRREREEAAKRAGEDAQRPNKLRPPEL